MRKIAAKYLLPFASVVLVVPSSFGQNPVSYLNDVGSPAYATNIPVPNGYINIANGNLHLEISLAAPPQRGAVKVNERLMYDSRIWMFTTAYGSGNHWWPYNIYGTSTSSGGWRLVTGAETGSLSTNIPTWTSSGCQQPYYGAPWEYEGDMWYTQYYSWTDPSGMTHPFSATEVWEETDCWDPAPPTYTPGGATDGSPYYLSFDAYNNPIITGLHGDQVYPSVSDRYGNGIGYDYSGNLIDDTGRTPVIATASGSTTYYDVLAPNGPISNNGTRARYTVINAPVPVSTNFGSGPHEWISPSDLQPVQSIQLPDGSQYTFSYDSYGELSSMTLPTGGTVTFGYSNVTDATNTPNRWVSSYQVGSNPATTFTAAACGGGCSQYVYMNRPSGDQTRYFFTINNGAWNTSTVVNSGTSTWAVISSATNTYSNPCTAYPCSGPNYLLSTLSQTSVFDPTGTYGLGLQTYTTYAPLLGPSAVQQWDYVSGGTFSSTPTRETDYTYTSSGDPDTVTVKDSAGAPVAQTTYGYTTSAAAPSPTPPMYSPSGATVSYLHTVQNWLNTNPSASPTTTITMDATGQVTSVQDANGNAPTTTTYQCSNSLPRFVEPLGSGTYKTTYGYDCGSSAITSVQDPNGNTTGYNYESTAGRLHSISYPDGGSTTYTYVSPNEVDTSIDALPDPTITAQSIVDGFGRPYQTIQNGVTSTTSYDTSGRVYCVDNPYALGSSTSGQTCITSYDTLNRPLTKTLPDGSTQHSAYTVDTTALKAVTTVTDEAGNQTQNFSDVFGQLRTVVEPGPSGNLTTNYAYNGLGNLTQINQLGLGSGSGDAPRTRTFDYDSLSRLLCASNPENSSAACPGGVGTSYAYTAGTLGYGYDPNGNVTSMEDARGTSSIVTNTYDTLNRLTAKTGSGINYHYYYDAYSGLPNSNSIGRMVYAWNGATAAEGFSYDSMGRLNWEASWTPGTWGGGGNVDTASYDHAGNMTDFTYADGHHIHQSFNTSAQLTGINYADWSGIPVNYPYVSGITYSPLGGISAIALGNGVNESISYNNRSQPCEIAASYPVAPGSSTLAFASDKQYYFSSAGTGGVCGAATNNNGNVWHIDDALASATKKQDFTFDNLNRLTSGVRADSGFNYTYNIDSFGNMQQNNNLVYNPPITFSANNQIQVASAYSYDAAGNLQDTGSSSGGHHYTYDALGQQTQVDYGTTATYTYDAMGHRIRKDVPSGDFTEYNLFGGQAMADWHQALFTWQDNVYANGQLVARDHSADTYIEFSGTNSASGNAWAYSMPIPSGITIQSGAKLKWRQYQSGAASPQGGIGLVTTSGTWTNWWMSDTDGQVINSDTTQNAWHSRTVDLTPIAGQTLSWAFVVADSNTTAGAWNEKMADIALVQPDGTVYTFYNNQTFGSFGAGWGTSGVSGQAFNESQVWNPYIPELTTHYFLADHLGSTRVEFAGGGWPVWGEDYAPYGQEVSPAGSPEATSNIYKFSGYERDPETAIAAGVEEDYAQARYYSSAIQGRFMSPDPDAGSMNLANPQSFNRYTYAMNNPLKFVDPSGLSACVYDNGDGSATVYYDEDGGCGGDGFYIDNAGTGSDGSFTPITGLSFDSNGDLSLYGVNGQTFNGDGTIFGVQQGVTVDANGDTSDVYFMTNNSSMPGMDPDQARISGLVNGIATDTKFVACLQDAIGENGISLALDAAGFLPGPGVQLGVAAASFVNALHENDATGSVLSIKGAQVSVADLAFRSIGEEAPKMIPIVGGILNTIGTIRDLDKVRKAYNACMRVP